MNMTGPDGRRIIAVGLHFGPIVAGLFQWHATGECYLKNVAGKIRAEGPVQGKTGAPMPIGAARGIPEDKIHAGSFKWDGRLCQGIREPLVSVELREKVQLAGKETIVGGYRRGGRGFPFAKLTRCTGCGHEVVAGMKKGKFVCRHCTGLDRRGPGETGASRRKHVREEAVERQFAVLPGQLRLDGEVFQWMRETLLSGEQDRRTERDAAGHG